MSSNELSKTEYLKRYLEGDKKSKKKKKVKINPLVPRIKILDQDISIRSMNFDGKEEVEEEDAPVVAEIIDDRPEEIKVKELYESSRWKKLDSFSDDISSTNATEPPIKKSKPIRHDSDSDISPPHRPQLSAKRRESDSDCSPPRKSTSSRKKNNSNSDCSPPRKKAITKRHDSCSQSPPTKRRHDSDCDLSPPRRSRKENFDHKVERTKVLKQKRNDSDSDLSPKRKKNKPHSIQNDSDSDLSPPRGKDRTALPKKTLSGLSAGLQSAATLREETRALRDREKKQINMLDEEVSGRNAETILRDRNTGKRRDVDQENKEKEEKEKKASEQQKKYAEWGKGIEQTESRKKKFEGDLYEMSKPLARYCDDEDLELQLKSAIYDDDPMAEYVKKKRKNENVSSMPEYTGPPPPPNRFGIKPGYRWDGVDRSNGFERKIFEKNNFAKATEEEAHLWSVQNM